MFKKTILVGLLLTVALGAFATPQKKAAKATAKTGGSTASTLIHFITVKWKDDATAEQKQAALDGARKMAGVVPGLLRVWTKKVKLQTTTQDGKEYDAIIAMEFTNEAALEAYTKHAAHDEWYKIYLPIRQESRTHDVSN
ncbi:MAG: Dabb family protein [Blastocatellia bacterium]